MMLNLFISYAPQDELFLKELEEHLALLQRQGTITTWHDHDISAGSELEHEIGIHLSKAHIILLLVSSSFLASERYTTEMITAMERQKAGEARVIPIILRHVDWKDAPFGGLGVLPTNALPIISWRNKDEAYANIIEGIKKAIKELEKKTITRSAIAAKVDVEAHGNHSQAYTQMYEATSTKRGSTLSSSPQTPVPLESILNEEEKRQERSKRTRSGQNLVYSWMRQCNTRCWLRTSFAGNILLLLALVLSLMIPHSSPSRPESSCSLPCYISTSDNQYIGISDGSDNFPHWQGDDILDYVENMIAAENRQVLLQPYPYVTLVILTTLTPNKSDSGYGRDDLQGFYTLQNEVNTVSNIDCPQQKCFRIRLLLANAGAGLEYASTVVKQIETLPQNNHVLGVVGWPVSTSYAIQAIQELSQAHILMMSATESSDALTAISPYYFRVAPVDSEQGTLDADIVSRAVPQNPFSAVKTAAVFYDDEPTHPFGRTLSSAFIERFSQESDHKIILEPYRGEASDQLYQTFGNDLKSLPTHAPYLIYFAGYSDSFSVLLRYLSKNQTPTNLEGVVSGNTAYDLIDYVTHKGYKNLYFTTFAFPDEWGYIPFPNDRVCSNASLSYGQSFFCEYFHNFYQSGKCSQLYGCIRADSNVIQAYDSASVLVDAYVLANRNFSADVIRTELLGNKVQAFAGVGGPIVFGSDGNPLNKPMVWVKVNEEGEASLQEIVQEQGQGFLEELELPLKSTGYNWGQQ